MASTNPYKFIILIILFNMMMILINNFQHGLSDERIKSDFGSIVGSRENATRTINGRIQDVNQDATQAQYERSAIDRASSEKGFIGLLTGGMASTYLGCWTVNSGNDCSNEFKWWVNTGVWVFVMIINSLMLVELYFIIFNKKT